MNDSDNTGGGGCRGGSGWIARFVEAEVLPAAEARAGEGAGGDALAVFRRILRVFQSITVLGGPEYYESAAALAAALFEKYMDMCLLVAEGSEDMPRRYREFAEIQKFRAAHRMAEFHERRDGETALDAGEQLKFREETGGIEAIREKVKEVWGADNRGKGSYPVHWSGRKCTRQISQDMGVEYEELYIEAYSMLTWLMHSGFSRGGGPDTGLEAEIFEWCHGISQLVMLEGAALVLETRGGDEKPEWLRGAIEKLRGAPGTALAADWFEKQAGGKKD